MIDNVPMMFTSRNGMPSPAASPPTEPPPTASDDDKRLPVATRLVNYVLHPSLGVELFRDPGGEGYITAPVNGTRQTWAIRSPDCQHWLTHVYYEIECKTLSDNANREARALLECRARFEGPVHPVFVRVGHDNSGTYIDLCNDAREVINIVPGRWQLTCNAPVRFRCCRGMLPLPAPEPSADLNGISLLFPFLNVRTTDSWLSVLAWLTHALLPTGPYAVLLFSGPPGSAKTTASRMLRSLVDPADAAVRSVPRNEEDFFIAAHNAWIMTTDNLSRVREWLSDALCRLATGGAFVKRRLYSDSDEVQFSVCRPVLLNAIEDVATRSDLLERLLTVELSPISPGQRRLENELWQQFNRDRPRILGSLLTLTAQALMHRSSIVLPNLPRMADFAQWGEAVARVLGCPPGAFLALLTSNTENAAQVTLDATPLHAVLERVLTHTGLGAAFVGTASDLLRELNRNATDAEKRHWAWPKAANKLAGTLRRIAACLHLVGIDYRNLQPTAGGRRVAVWRTGCGMPPEVAQEASG